MIAWRGLAASTGAALMLVGATWLPSHVSRHVAMVLYRADWRHGKAGWISTGNSWSVRGGILSFDGKGRSTILAPYAVKSGSYAVIARMRLITYRGTGVYTANSFGILFDAGAPLSHGRLSALGGGMFEVKSLSGETYSAAIITNPNDPSLDQVAGNYDEFVPSSGWHTYRVTVKGHELSLDIDGTRHVVISQNHVPAGHRVGIFGTASAFQIAGFEVTST